LKTTQKFSYRSHVIYKIRQGKDGFIQQELQEVQNRHLDPAEIGCNELDLSYNKRFPNFL